MCKLKVISVFVMLVFCIEHSLEYGGSRLITENVKYRCEPVTMNYCAQIGYNSTIMPNILNHKTQEEAAMELYGFSPLFIHKCSSDLRFFVCSIYIPMCTILGRPVPPCRSLCMKVKEGCEPVMNLSGFDWPEEFDCKKFPKEQNGDLCVNEYIPPKPNVHSTAAYDGTLFYSKKDRIDSMNVKGETIEKPLIQPIKNSVYIEHASGLTFDYKTGRIIYGDSKKGTINSVYFNGTGHFVLASDQGSVKRLEFDPISRVLYWVYKNDLFHKVSLCYMKLSDDGTNASNIRVLFRAPFFAKITGIAVDECAVNIFWSQCSKFSEAAIYKTRISDLRRETVISTEIHRPSALTLDHQNRQLYWSDKWVHKIERCQYDGTNRVILVQAESAAKIYGMTVYANYLYWTEWWTSSLYRVDKMTGQNIVTLEERVESPIDVIVIKNNTNECPVAFKEKYLN